jgi:hypothetical protein
MERSKMERSTVERSKVVKRRAPASSRLLRDDLLRVPIGTEVRPRTGAAAIADVAAMAD